MYSFYGELTRILHLNHCGCPHILNILCIYKMICTASAVCTCTQFCCCWISFNRCDGRVNIRGEQNESFSSVKQSTTRVEGCSIEINWLELSWMELTLVLQCVLINSVKKSRKLCVVESCCLCAVLYNLKRMSVYS